MKPGKPSHLETNGTMHLSTNDFADLFAEAEPGEAIVYAIGDVGFSAPYGAELTQLKKMVWERFEAGLLCLTQRASRELAFEKAGGRSFHYIATKRDIVVRKSA